MVGCAVPATYVYIVRFDCSAPFAFGEAGSHLLGLYKDNGHMMHVQTAPLVSQSKHDELRAMRYKCPSGYCPNTGTKEKSRGPDQKWSPKGPSAPHEVPKRLYKVPNYSLYKLKVGANPNLLSQVLLLRMCL